MNRERYIIFAAAIVGAPLLTFVFSQVFPNFGLWMQMNPTIMIGTLVLGTGLLWWFLFGRQLAAQRRAARAATPTPGATAATPPTPGTPPPARRPFPLSWQGIVAIVACIAMIVWVLVDDRIPDYLLLHIATVVLVLRYIATATGAISADMVRLLTGVLLLVTSVILVFTTIELDPEWLFGFLTGGVPFLVMLTVVLSPAMGVAGRRYASAIVEACICFTLVYVVVALMGLEVNHRLAYALFLSPVLFAVSTLFPTITLTNGQRWWMIGLGFGLAALYTLMQFGLPRMNIPVPTGLTWKIVTLAGLFLLLTLISDRYPRLTLPRQLIIVALLAIVLFPELVDIIKRVVSWLPLILSLAAITWLWTVDDINRWVKGIFTIIILIVFWPKQAKAVWEWILNAGDNIAAINISLSGNGWWIGLILLVVVIVWGSWYLFGNRWATALLLVAGIAVYGLATGVPASVPSIGWSVPSSPSTESPASPTTPKNKKGSKKTTWEKYPGSKPADIPAGRK